MRTLAVALLVIVNSSGFQERGERARAGTRKYMVEIGRQVTCELDRFERTHALDGLSRALELVESIDWGAMSADANNLRTARREGISIWL